MQHEAGDPRAKSERNRENLQRDEGDFQSHRQHGQAEKLA
jgi:hypothetical protein